jgi:hypothetical protein
MTNPKAQNPVPLSVDRHGMRRWRRFSDYGFVRTRRMVPVVLAEADLVAACLPLVFAAQGDGPPQPVALLRLAAETTPFVDVQGRWLAPYVPAIVRVHPFSARPATDNSERMVLLVDEAGGFMTDDVHQPRFFDPFGAPDPALEAVVTFFQQFEVSGRATRTACAALQAEGLFEPLDAKDTGLADLFGIDRAALAGLGDAAFLRLRSAGAIDLAQAHFVGSAQLAFLRRAEAALAAGAVPDGAGLGLTGLPGNTAAAPSSGLADFLAALAAAEDGGDQDHAAFAPPTIGVTGRNGGQE